MGASDRPLRWAQIPTWHTSNLANATAILKRQLGKLVGNQWSLVTEHKKGKLQNLQDDM